MELYGVSLVYYDEGPPLSRHQSPETQCRFVGGMSVLIKAHALRYVTSFYCEVQLAS
jgi:hypothetical protein